MTLHVLSVCQKRIKNFSPLLQRRLAPAHLTMGDVLPEHVEQITTAAADALPACAD